MIQKHLQETEQTETNSKQFTRGARVYVDFISDSRTEFSGKQIKGFARVDRHENGYVYGQLEQGTPFMCPEKYVELTPQEYIKQLRVEFEQWLRNQDQYSILIQQFGNDVFIYDAIDGYQKLAVSLAFELWKMLHLCREENKALLKKLSIPANVTEKTTLVKAGGNHE